MERTRISESPEKVVRSIRRNEIVGSREDSRWHSSTPEYHIAHMIHAHLTPISLFGDVGVPRFDIEAATKRGINLQPFVERIYEFLNTPDPLLKERIGKSYSDPIYTPFLYKAMLVKTLLYVELQEPRIANIDWEKVEASFPGARHVVFDIEIDSRECSLKEADWKGVLRYDTSTLQNKSTREITQEIA